MTNGKKCPDCKRWKLFSAFYKNCTYRDGHQKRCKKCAEKYYNIWRRTKHGKERIHIAQVKNRFGLSEEGYKKLQQEQRGRCAICERRTRKRLDVDHSHSTKKVRGLLCGKCNRAIGLFSEDVYNLQKAVSYLQYYEKAAMEGKII